MNVDVSGAGQYSDKGGASPFVMDPNRSTDTLMPIRQLFESVNDTRQSHSSYHCAAAAWKASPPASRDAYLP